MNRWVNLGLFLFVFGVFAWSAAPQVPPYRDSGEMVSVVHTLGVAHAPGYPLYIQAGKVFSLLPLGNAAFRLNVFSSFCAAACVWILFILLRHWTGVIPAFLGSLYFGFSVRFWELALVPEMYTMGVFWLGLVLGAAFVMNNAMLTFFLMGLGLGVRMDSLLLLPLFVIWFWPRINRSMWLWNFVFLGAGLSVFFFLPIRAMQDPVLNWGDPRTWGDLLHLLTRKSYGGTLDLLSLNYAKGENLLANLKLYGMNFLQSVGWWGVGAAVIGVVSMLRRHPKEFYFFGSIFVLMGPFFLFLANMPPNPHALAIVEANYLVPDFILCIFIAFGLHGISGKRVLTGAALGVTLVSIAALAWGNHGIVNKRHNFYARDFVGNILRSAPKNSVVALHKDVQLFSLWAAQLVEGRRLDLGVIATGLSGSPWYWAMLSRWGTQTPPAVSLKEPHGWETLKIRSLKRGVLFGQDTDFGDSPNLTSVPFGLLSKVVYRNDPLDIDGMNVLDDFCVYRGRYKYALTPDFFSTDLIGDVARAYYKRGFHHLLQGRFGEADYFMRRSQSLDPTFPRPLSDRAYMSFSSGNFEKAARLQKLAIAANERLIRLADDYNSLPDVRAGIKKDLAEVLVNYGASLERLNQRDLARSAYGRSIALAPSPQAHYNMAVSYWGVDWNMAAAHLEEALRLAPQMRGANELLREAQRHIR